jgi:hypothetical protein
VEAILDEALQLAQSLGDLYHFDPVASARAETTSAGSRPQRTRAFGASTLYR